MAKFDSYDQGTPSWLEHSSADPQACKEFYGRVFGWDFEDNPMRDDDGLDLGTYSIATIQGDRIAGLGQVMTPGQPPSWGVYLAADDVEEAVKRAQEAGGQVLAGPMTVPEQGRLAWVADPTGASVGLWQSTGFAGSQRANEPGTNIWNELVTPDVDAAAPFYEKTLGLRAQPEEMPDGGGSYTGLFVGERMVGGTSTPEAGMPPHWNVYFNVESVDDTVAAAQQHGGRVVAPAFDVPGIGRMAVLADPVGATFNLMQSPAQEGEPGQGAAEG